MEGYQQGGGSRVNGGKGTGIKKHKWQVQYRQGEVKNSIGNGEAKELICKMDMNSGGGMMVGGWGTGRRGIKGRTKQDNCNSIIDKIYLKKFSLHES